MISLRVKFGATRAMQTIPTWDFSAAIADQPAAMNYDIADQVNTVGGGIDCAQRWESLHYLYVTAITAHTPQKHHRHRKPWIREHTLDLIQQRGATRTLGDLALASDLSKQIRRAAKADKRVWLDQQLLSGGWGPLKDLTKPFPKNVLRLHSRQQPDTHCTNAEVYVQHLSSVQWAPAGAAVGLADEPVLPATPIISETAISMAELTAAIKQIKPHKRTEKDQIPNDFWKHLQRPGLDALFTLFQSCWDGHLHKSPTMEARSSCGNL